MTQRLVLTPHQRQTVEMIQRSEESMMTRIKRAIEDAAKEVETGLKSIQFEEPAPHLDYFMAVAHRQLFLALCGASSEDGQGGNPVLAAAILDSDRNFVALNWEGKDLHEVLVNTKSGVAQTRGSPSVKE